MPGAAASFVEHIQLGIREAVKDEHALLLFSGGQTRKYAGPRSEALSYWLVAQSAHWFNHSRIQERTYLEVSIKTNGKHFTGLIVLVREKCLRDKSLRRQRNFHQFSSFQIDTSHR